jgi:hypothetical protein
VKQSARGSSAPHLISPSPAAAWDRVPLSLIERRPVFHVNPPCYLPPEALSLIREKLGLAEQSSESILL